MTGAIYNNILIIMERLTGYGVFILYKESSNAKKLVYSFLKWIYLNHKIPRSIIFNKNILFILKFWKSLIN